METFQTLGVRWIKHPGLDASPTRSSYIFVFKNLVLGQHGGAVDSIAASLLQGAGF